MKKSKNKNQRHNFSIFVLPAVLACSILWPLVSSRYQLSGGAAHELLTVNGLKSIFNIQLLQGMFPLWNDWVGNGKIFLFWGSSLLNFLTPFELIFGGNVSVEIYKAELFVIYATFAAILVGTSLSLKLPLWTACSAFFCCSVIGSITNLSHWVPWSQIYLFATSGVICLVMYFEAPQKKWVVLFSISMLFMTQGVRLDAFPMFLVIIMSLIMLRTVAEFILKRNPIKKICSDAVAQICIFILTPIGLFAWQIPLILNLLLVADNRTPAIDENYFQTITHTITAISVSAGTYYILIAALLALSMRIQNRSALICLQKKHAPEFNSVCPVPKKKYLTGLALLFLAGVGLIWWSPKLPMAELDWWILPITGALSMLLRNCLNSKELSYNKCFPVDICQSKKIIPTAISWAGIYCVIFEDMPQTGSSLEISFELKAIFLFVTVYGLLAGQSEKNLKLKGHIKCFALVLATGWIWRDILCIPLAEQFNILWVNRADMFWFIPPIAVFIMVGCSALYRDFCLFLRPRRHLVFTPTQKMLIASLIIALPFVSLSFTRDIICAYVLEKGESHQNAIWRRMTNDELARMERRRDLIVTKYQELAQKFGPEIRVLSQSLNMHAPDPLPDIGYPGGLAGRGVYDAWSHDFNSRYYRELAEKVFTDSTMPINFDPNNKPLPQLYMYNNAARKIYLAHAHDYNPNTESAINAVWANWTRNLLLSSGRSIDPLFLRLLRVGALYTANGPITEHSQIYGPNDSDSDDWDGKPVTYFFQTDQPIGRYGFLEQYHLSDIGRLNQSNLNRHEIVKILDKMLISDNELRNKKVTIVETNRTTNKTDLTITSSGGGVLFIFESWNPGWRVLINNRQQEIHRSLIAYRAVVIPPGNSTLTFYFEPAYFRAGVSVSLFTILAFVSFYFGTRKSQKQQAM